MKKLLLSLVGLFVAFAANADRYWIHGQIFGDSGWGSVELIKNETTGKYEKVGQIVPGHFGVRVTTEDEGNQTEWWSGPSGENKITEAGTFPIKSNDNSNFESTLTGNYTISLDWTAKTLTFTPYTGEIQEGPASYVLRGDCFGGSWTDKEMTESNGLWTWTGKITSTGTGKSLGIKKMVDGIQKGWYWAPTSRPGIISDAGLYYVVLQDGENGKNLTTKVNGEFTFTFNPETLELKITGENEGGNDFDDEKWYFVGQRTGWNAQEAYELTAGDNGEYVLDADWTMDPTKPFKFNNGNFDDDLEFGAQSEENNKVEVDVPYTLGGKGSGDLYVKEAINNPHIVLNPTTGVLTITSRGGDEPIVDPTKKPELYLTGSFQTTPWTLGATRYHFTREEDIYTLQFSGTLKATDQFKIADNDWEDDVDFGANANGNKVENGVPYTTVQHGTNNLQLSENLKDPKFVFDLTTGVLTVTGEAVEIEEPIEPTVYTYNIHGDIFASAEWTSVKLTEKDGKYVLENRSVEAGKFGIRVINPEITVGDPQVAWYASAGDGIVTLDTPMSITDSEPTDFEIKKGTYTFTLDIEAKTLTVTGQEEEDVDHVLSYRLRGAVAEGGEWKDYLMTEEDGKWSVTLDNALVTFGVRTWCSAHNKQFEFINSAAENPAANEAGEYEGKVGGSDWTSTLTGKTTYTYDPVTMKLTIANGSVVNPPVTEDNLVYNIHGNIFGDSGWTSKPMIKNAEGKYVLADVEVEKGNFGIRVLDSTITEEGADPQVGWYAAANSDDAAVVLDATIALGSANTTDLSITKGIYTFTFDLEAMTLVVTGEEIEDVDPVYAYAIKGAPDWEVQKMTEEDGVWSITLENALSEFGIAKIDIAHNNQQKEWISSADGKDIDAVGDFAAQVGGTNWQSSLTGKCTYIFDPENMVLTVDGSTGINTIDAEEGDSVYFNLQGQRVANPEKGIYIRVVNGKAQKVVK